LARKLKVATATKLQEKTIESGVMTESRVVTRDFATTAEVNYIFFVIIFVYKEL
jgi:hypothetical protein